LELPALFAVINFRICKKHLKILGSEVQVPSLKRVGGGKWFGLRERRIQAGCKVNILNETKKNLIFCAHYLKKKYLR
jgi:hypothetical protein